MFVGTGLSRRADKVLVFVGNKLASTIGLSQLCYCSIQKYRNVRCRDGSLAGDRNVRLVPP